MKKLRFEEALKEMRKGKHVANEEQKKFGESLFILSEDSTPEKTLKKKDLKIYLGKDLMGEGDWFGYENAVCMFTKPDTVHLEISIEGGDLVDYDWEIVQD